MPSIWYNVWVLVNNDTETYEVWLNSNPGGNATSGNKLTLPLGIGLAKTMVIGDRPWTFQLQYWNNIERPDAFGAEHTVRFGIAPVVSAPWNKGK